MRYKILVAGSDGYIGSVLCRKLQKEFEVTGYDTGYYRGASLYSAQWDLPKTITKDIRDITLGEIKGFRAVVCLSDLTDPLSQVYPKQTRRINFDGLARFASLCKRAGVKKFIYSSSASVYGFAADKIMREDYETNPLTPYAECKVLMEKHLLSLGDKKFSVTCLRNSTVYGLSPRMRFDLVINYLCATAVAKKTIELKSDGSAWRPFVHIDDLCDAFYAILKLPASKTAGAVINVGDKGGNHRIIDIARFIQEMTGCKITRDTSSHDGRSYRIDSKKLNSLGIYCRRSLKKEIGKMLKFFRQIDLSSDSLNCSVYNRLEHIRFLLKTKQLDKDLFWRIK